MSPRLPKVVKSDDGNVVLGLEWPCGYVSRPSRDECPLHPEGCPERSLAGRVLDVFATVAVLALLAYALAWVVTR